MTKNIKPTFHLMLLITIVSTLISSSVYGQWSTATLSEARSHMAAASVGTKVLFAGGINAASTSAVVDIYDSSTDAWTTATLSQDRQLLSATTVGDKVIFAGGYNSTSATNSAVVDIYDNSTDTWSTASLTEARRLLCATTVGDKAIFAGGYNGASSAVVDIYDNSTGIWSTATLSVAREQLSATTVGNKAFFAGGSGPSSRVDIYDNSTGTWTTSTLSEARYFLSATTVGDKAIFAGGWNASVRLATVDIYNNSTDTWSTTSLSVARDQLTAVNLGSKAFFAGGKTAGSVWSSNIDIYDNLTNTWSSAALSEARAWFGAASVGDQVFFAGGEIGSSTYTSTVDIYTLTLEDKLLASYPFSGNATDATGNGYDGVLNGTMVGTADRFGLADQAYQFDGVDDFVELSGSTSMPSTDGSITVSAWIKPSSFPEGETTIASNYDNTSGFDFLLSSNGGTQANELKVEVFGGGFLFGGLPALNAWSHVVMTWKSGTGVKTYLNGTEVGVLNTTNTADAFNSTLPITLGDALTHAFFSGAMDEVKIYNYALTASEVTNLYNDEAPTELIADYSFTGNANDATGYNNNGALGDGVTATTFPTLTTDRDATAGAAYSFDGGDYIAVPTSGSFSIGTATDISVSGWFKTTTQGVLFDKSDGTVGYFAMVQSDGSIYWYMVNGATSFSLTSATGFADDAWHHYTVIADRDAGMQIYIDGALSTSNSSLTNVINPDGVEDFLIGVAGGVDNTGLDFFFNGSLDDIAVYTKALTASEVTDLYGVAASTETDFLTFTATAAANNSDYVYSTTIDTDLHTIRIELDALADPADLTFDFTLSTGATATVDGLSRTSGVSDDYSSPVTYTITAQDGVTTQAWEVSSYYGIDEDATLSSFSFPEQTGTATIGSNTVDIEVAFGTDVTALVASFETTGGGPVDIGGVAQTSGTTANDFTNSVVYTVTSNNGNVTQDYTVTVTVADGLLAYYSFDAGDATDDSGNGRTGDLGDGVTATTFPTLTADRDGVASQAFSFDGGDYIAVPHDAGFNWGTDVDVTAMCWFNTTSTTYGDLIFKEDGTNGLIVAIDATGTINLYGGEFLTSNTTGLNDGTWHHVAVVLDRDQGMAIYLDGAFDAGNALATNIYNFTDTREFLIGSGQDISSVKNTFYTGAIDNVRIYDEFIGVNAIQDVFVSEGGSLPSIVAPVVDAPFNLTNTTFDLSWGAVTDATGYNVQVATDDVFTSPVIDQAVTETTFTATGLTQGTSYFARVNATDGVNTSAYSNTVEALTTNYSSSTDSAALVTFYGSTAGEAWVNGWNVSQPMDTWYGVTLDANRRVTDLILPDNNLSGSLPAEIGDLTELRNLSIHSNSIAGTIPTEIGNLSKLEILSISLNEFEGSIPAEIGNLSNLIEIYLNNNNLTGTIPASLGQLSNLNLLYLYRNQLTGTIPVELGNLTNAADIAISFNNLTGAVPAELANLTNLEGLYLNNNEFTSIPDLSALPFTVEKGLYVRYNKIGFADIVANMGIANAGNTYVYHPQLIEQEELIEVANGVTANLSTTESYAGTVYQWFYNNDTIPGATAIDYSFVMADGLEGAYTVRMTNTAAPNLIISRANYLVSDGVNAAPVGVNLSTSSVFDFHEVGTTVANLSTEDDPGDTHTFTLVAGTGDTHNAFFSITENELILETALDFDVNPILNIRLAVEDALGLSDTTQVQLEVIPEIICQNEVLTASQGTFNDGSNEYEYQNGFSCSWLIEGSTGQKITLGFNSFDTELDYDFVTIYDGSDTGAPVLGRFSGQSIPSELTSTGNTMLVVFESDQLVVSQGWEAYYTIFSDVLEPLSKFGDADGIGGFGADDFSDQVSTEMTIEFLVNVDQFPAAGVYGQFVQLQNTNIQYIEDEAQTFRNVEFHTGDGEAGSVDSWTAVNDTELGGFDPGKWYHFAFVYSNGMKYIYMNGFLVKEEAFEWLNGGNVSRLDVVPNMDAKIDELRFWNIARTQTEISNNLQNELVGTETGLVGYWQFNTTTDLGDGSFSVPDLTSSAKDLIFNPNDAGVDVELALPVFTSTTGITSSSFTVNWEEVVDAEGYQLVIDDSDVFDSPEFSESLDAATFSFTATGLNSETIYFVELVAVAGTTQSVAAYNSVQTASLLTAYYPFNANANDESGNGFNGQLGDGADISTMPVAVADRLSNASSAYTFDGGDYIVVDGNSAFDVGTSTDFSFSGWFKSSNAAQSVLFDKSNGATGYLTLLLSDGSLQFFMVQDGVGNASLTTSRTGMNDGHWHHYAISIDRDNGINIYIDGMLSEQSTTLSNGINPDTIEDLLIGVASDAGNTNLNNFFIGDLDDIRIYSDLITPTQASNLYQQGWEGLSNETEFLSFQLTNQIGVALIDPDTKTIEHNIASAGDITNQVVTYSLSTGASAELNGVALESAVSPVDFTSSVAIDVIAENGFTTQTWILNVTQEAGLVAYYPFTGGSLVDESLNGNDVALGDGSSTGLNPSLAVDRYENNSGAYSFDGVDDYLSINNGSGINISGNMSVVLWVNPNEIGSNGRITWDSGSEYGDFIIWSDGRLAYNYKEGTNNSTVFSSSALSAGKWSLIAFTRTGDQISFFINGYLDATQTAHSPTTVSNLTSIGGSESGVANTFNGVVDDIRIYGRSLTTSEIVDIYKSERTSSGFDLSNSTIAENLESGTEIGVFSEEGTYTLVSGSSDFSISGTSLVSARSFDFEAQSSYDITVSYNNGGSVIEQDFTISIENIEEFPIIEQVNFPSSVDLSTTSTVMVSAGAFDPDGLGIESASIGYFGSTDKEVLLNFNPDFIGFVDGVLNNGVYEFSIPTSGFDLLGLTFFINVTDFSGSTTSSEVYSISTSISSDNSSVGNVNVSTGSLSSNYRIISIPLKSVSVSDVFSDLSGQGKDVWRLLRYNGTSNTELSSTSNLEAGKGYWFLNTQQTSFSIPTGETVSASFDTPFEITLNTGWNQIGNPYPYAIDWNEVLAANGIASSLFVYEGGWGNSSTLNVFEGGFFENVDGLSSLMIPVTAINSARIQSRSSVTVNEGILGSDNWSFGLKVQDAQLSYNVTQIGMNQDSKAGFDKNDAHVLPRLPEYLDIEFAENLTKEIVSSGDYHKWEFDVNSTTGGKVTLSWDNMVLQGNTYGLLLWDVDNQELVDLSQTTGYTFKSSGVSTSFELYYGRKDELLSKINLNADLMSSPYPNPFNDDFVIPVATQSENTDLNITLLDLSGREILLQTHSDLGQGFHEFNVNPGQGAAVDFRSGTYLVRVEVVTASYRKVFNKRVVYIR
ncbi:LamG-like jellyroll fold domain-containing protein [Reichenbachiella ulvae]|uniref:LamG domain-containing protein n=1 Tax=Reichenbachiella ulvae TaxID=2980104 RepID=A0ABT3D052_9BACT|nr:LamG-like jellyroll fold domain-containing protein [Reichenbachiella ulvae]MCV9389328.1 LamG domain-containing protein [Reichenbachiella ulvae]